ncbi:MAG: hypothetical protein JWL65_3326 [Gammaproteobacteria bacterium]|nr:hypothetical protein [Gammaproteobacteria bacterium]
MLVEADNAAAPGGAKRVEYGGGDRVNTRGTIRATGGREASIEHDDDSLASLPRFAPREPQLSPQPADPAPPDVDANKPSGSAMKDGAKADPMEPRPAEGGRAETLSEVGREPPPPNPIGSPEAEVRAQRDAKESEAGPRRFDTSSTQAPPVSPDLRALLRKVVEEVLAERAARNPGGTAPTAAELGHIADVKLRGTGRPPGPLSGVEGPDAVNTVAMTPGQRVQIKGLGLLGEGLAATVGGAAAAVGAVGRAVGAVARNAADRLSGSPNGDRMTAADQASDRAAVLPRLSEYRIGQVDKAARGFMQEQDAFWASSSKLTQLRAEMQRIARERGLSVPEVIGKMRPGGDFAELRRRFNEAVTESADAGTRKRAMDRALDGFIRHYGRAQEEVINPELIGKPRYERLKERLQKSHQDMESSASTVPAFDTGRGELEPSHLERLKAAVQHVMERLKDVLQEFTAMLRGRGDSESAPNAP